MRFVRVETEVSKCAVSAAFSATGRAGEKVLEQRVEPFESRLVDAVAGFDAVDGTLNESGLLEFFQLKTRAGRVLAGALALSVLVPVTMVKAQELSEMAVKSFMDFAWSLTPAQFSKPDGTTIQIDKKKRDEVMVPVDVAREVIKVGRLSAHAQVCDLPDHQTANHRTMMRKEEAKGKWTPQQLVYISQLHLTTVMLLTGKLKLVEKGEDGKDVIVGGEDDKKPAQTCSEEQRKKVKEMIAAYVKENEGVKAAAGDAPAAATTTGSNAAAKTAPAAAAPAPAPKK